MPAVELEQLIGLLAKLPAFGPRSARRAVLSLVQQKESQFIPLVQAMENVVKLAQTCSVCGNVDTQNPCSICADSSRDKGILCVVADVGDVWALERANVFRGVYHVLGGVLSALDGVGPDELALDSLWKKVQSGGVKEVIFALPATVEGQTTQHYIKDSIQSNDIIISTLSRGVPLGGELDYLDDGTLQLAFSARKGV